MKEKVQQLEAFDGLETKVEEQESLLIGLQRQTCAKSAAGQNSDDPFVERNFETYRKCNEAIAYHRFLRTCGSSIQIFKASVMVPSIATKFSKI